MKSTIEIIKEVSKKFEKELKDENINNHILVSHSQLKGMRNILNKFGITKALCKTKPTNRYINKALSEALYSELKKHKKTIGCKNMRDLTTEYINSKIVKQIEAQNFTNNKKLIYLTEISFSSRKLSQFLTTNGFTTVDIKNKNKSFISVELKNFIENELIKDEIFKELFYTQIQTNNKEK